MTLTRPQAGQPLSNPSGPAVMDEYADAIEQAQADITAAQVDIAALESGGTGGGSPNVKYADAFTDLAAVALHSADTISGGSPSGTWTVVLPQSQTITAASWLANVVTFTSTNHTYEVGDPVVVSNSSVTGYNGTYVVTSAAANTFTAALGSNPGTFSGNATAQRRGVDTTDHAAGSTASIVGDLQFDNGVAMLYCDLDTPATMGAHLGVEIDAMFEPLGYAGSYTAYQLVIANGPALAGTQVSTLNIPSGSISSAWATYIVPKGTVTSVKSFGVRRIAGSGSGSGSRHIVWNLDNPRLSAESPLDLALSADDPVAVVIPADYVAPVGQGLLSLGTTKTLLDLRPSSVNLSNFRGVKSLRDYGLDETGTTDMTSALQVIANSCEYGDLVLGVPGAKYRADGEIVLSVDGVTWDMQGARIFESARTGAPMINVQGNGITMNNWRLFGPSGVDPVTPGSSLTALAAGVVINQGTEDIAALVAAGLPTLSGGVATLDGINEAVRVPVRPGQNAGGYQMTQHYIRDVDGYIQFDITLHASAANTVARVSFTDHDGVPDYTTTRSLTTTPTVYTFKYRLINPAFARQRCVISKEAAGGSVTVTSVKGYRMFDYPPNSSNIGLNTGIFCKGSNLTIDNLWCEGMGGDGFSTRGTNSTYGLHVRRYFGRGTGRDVVAITGGNDVTIEDFVLAPCSRDAVDVEPEGNNTHTEGVRFFNGIMTSGWNYGFTTSGGGDQEDFMMEKVWLNCDSGPVFQVTRGTGWIIRDLVYSYYGIGNIPGLVFNGGGMRLTNITSDGTVSIGGNDTIARGVWVKNVNQAGAFVVTGANCDVDDITVGDPVVPFVLDVNAGFYPVQLKADTRIGRIRCPAWTQEFGNTFKSDTINGELWYPHGQDMLGSGVRGIRGLSATTTPANNLRGLAQTVTAAATTATVAFPVRTDVMQPADFSLTPAGPEIQRANIDLGVDPNVGTYTLTYNGATTIPLDLNAAATTTVNTAFRALGTVGTNCTVTGTSLANQQGLTFTWAAAQGNIPNGLLSGTSSVLDKNNNIRPIDIDEIEVGGTIPPTTYYYRVAGRTFEGQPLQARGEKFISLTTQNAVKINTSVGGAQPYSTGSDIMIAGFTVYRGTTSGSYNRKYDIVGVHDVHMPTSATDIETSCGGAPPITLSPALTTADLNINSSGYEADTNYGVWITPNWLTTYRVSAKRTGGFDVQFGTAAPGGATFDWGLVR